MRVGFFDVSALLVLLDFFLRRSLLVRRCSSRLHPDWLQGAERLEGKRPKLAGQRWRDDERPGHPRRSGSRHSGELATDQQNRYNMMSRRQHILGLL